MNKNMYETDYFGWVYEQANLLKNKEYGKLDMDHLIEEIESLGNSPRNKLESHLTILLMHLLKIQYQPDYHTKSWDLSIKNAKFHVRKTINKNPSLKSELEEIYNDAYYLARLDASKETSIHEKTFPKECPWKFEEIMEEKE